jgi:type VI secretion system protein
MQLDRLPVFRLPRLLAVFLCAAAVAGLTSCSTYQSAKNLLFPPGEKLHWSELGFLVEPLINENSPVAVDLVLVRDTLLVARLDKLSAQQWFFQKASLQQAAPDDLVIRSWELTPGDSLRVPQKDLPSERALRVFLFTGYRTPGDHRLTLEPLAPRVLIDFGPSQAVRQGVPR